MLHSYKLNIPLLKMVQFLDPPLAGSLNFTWQLGLVVVAFEHKISVVLFMFKFFKAKQLYGR